MFAKVFAQILDSSLAENYQVRLVFEDLLKLADEDGVVDITRESIARRTNVPLQIVAHGISELEKPDSTSRSPNNEGRRIVRLDEHRDWGWRIVNFLKYRESATKEMLRMAESERKAEWRRRKGFSPVPPLKSNKEEEEEAEQSRLRPDLSGTSPDIETQARILIHWLNQHSGRSFRESDSSFKFIVSRLKERDVTLEGCKSMVIRQCKMWKDDPKMCEFLRPQTLFRETNFNSYYAAKDLPVPERNNGTYRQHTQENPRNLHTCKPVTDYGEAGRRKLEKQEEERLARQVAQNAALPPSA